MSGLEVLQLITNLAFVAGAVLAIRLWHRHRSRSSMWMALSFSALGLVVLYAEVTSLFIDEAVEDPAMWVIAPLVLILLTSPYLLWRFSHELAPMSHTMDRVLQAGFVVSVVVMFTPGLLDADPDAPRSAAVILATLVILAYWATANLHAGYNLWRAARSRPGMVARRLQTLAVATILLAVTLVVSAFGDSEVHDPTWVDVLSAALAITAAGGFLLGFAPPPIVRAAWRHASERSAFAVASESMRAENPQQVVEAMLPVIQAVTGATSVRLFGPDGELVGSRFLAQEHLSSRGSEPDVRQLQLGGHRLELELDQSVPMFGEDDLEALERITTVGAVAFERTQLLERERALRRDLEFANDDLQAFVTSTSHDMKNPLFAIRGFVDVVLAERAGPISPEATHYLKRVRSNVEFMDQLISDLLELSRIGQVEVEAAAIDVGALLDELLEGIRERAPEFTVEYTDLPSVWMNPGRAQQVFANLLENASRYGGRPDITVTVVGQVQGGHVELVVCDDGGGVPESGREDIFKPFTRLVGKEQPGTGLGLAICRRIIESGGGTIELLPHGESSCAGAAFRLRLPRPPERDASATPDAMSVEAEVPDNGQRPLSSVTLS